MSSFRQISVKVPSDLFVEMAANKVTHGSSFSWQVVNALRFQKLKESGPQAAKEKTVRDENNATGKNK